MGLTGYSLTRANKREKDAERSDEEMRLKSAKRSARVELQRTARNIRDMLETLHAWKRSPLSERKAFYQLLSGSFAKNSPQSGQTYDLRFSWSLSVCMLSVPLFTMKHVHKPRAI